MNSQGIGELFFAIFSKVYSKARMIYHLHGVFNLNKINFIKKIFYKIYFNIFDVVVNDVFSESKKVNIFLNKNKSKVFTYGSNLKLIKAKKHNKFTLVFVGRVAREKKIEDIIFAIKPLKNIKLIIIGPVEDHQYYMYLKNISRNLDVEFTGFLDRKKIQEKFSISDIFVNMSPNEVFGRVFVEALSSGIPVIGNPKSPGPKEIIIHGKNGWLIRDSNELKKFLINIDFKELERVRKNCIKYSKKYSYIESYKKLKNILLEKR